MTLQKLQFRSGLNTQVSQTANEGGWSDGQLIRFRDGLPETWAGWAPAIGTQLSGVPRAIMPWQQLDSTFNVAFGTSSHLYLLQGGSLYDITPAGSLASAPPGTGYGVGLYGKGAYGTPRVGTVAPVTAIRTWSLATFGENLIGVPRDGGLYVWAPSSGTSTVASLITNTGTPSSGPPLRIGAMLMGLPERHVVLLGSSSLNSSSGFDPMLVRFCSVEDYTDWYATATNSAGSYRLEGGTRLVGGLCTTGAIMIWSDLCVFTMRFIGAPYYYAFDRVATNAGIVGPNAAAYWGGIVYWMSKGNFYRYAGGTAAPIPCTIYDTVFKDMSLTAGDKTWCGVNPASGEVIWGYQSLDGADVDRYASFRPESGDWSFGRLARTAWATTPSTMPPIATGPDGTIYNHEVGVDSIVITGGTQVKSSVGASITSGYYDIGDGTQIQFVNRIIPDFAEQSGTVYMTLHVSDYPNTPPRQLGPYALTPDTQYVTTRARGRQLAVTLQTRDVGSYFRLGALRINAIPDGQR